MSRHYLLFPNFCSKKYMFDTKIHRSMFEVLEKFWHFNLKSLEHLLALPLKTIGSFCRDAQSILCHFAHVSVKSLT